jgi:predicted PurR-regulated permease PerM
VTNTTPTRDLARITLAVLLIGLLTVASLLVLEPFLAATVWAAMVVIATWPLMIGVQARLGGRRWLAVAVMTLAILLVLVMPLVIAISTVARHSEDIAGWARDTASAGVPSPPGWVEKIPLAGPRISQEWARLAASSREELAERAAPYARKAIQWFVEQAGGAGRMLVHLLLTIVITVILYTTGEKAAKGIRRFARRLAGDRGDGSVVLAGQAVRAVALGVVVTAIAQTAASGIGLAVCGVPYAIVLTALIFVLCIAQLGPVLVLVPALGWLYWKGEPVWGTVLVVWTLIVGTLDNVLRPLLIKRGADLPLLLIFAGVIGGLLSLGIIGLFVGPVVLAVTYRLLEAWISDIDRTGAENVAPAVTTPSAQRVGEPESPTGAA